MQIERSNILNCVRAFALLMLNKEIDQFDIVDIFQLLKHSVCES